MQRLFKHLLVSLAVALPLVQPAHAQPAWPAKPVRIIVPFAPGGTTDVVARLVGQKLGELWGQSVVIENHSGAGGNVGADLVAHAQADGYTVLMASGSIFTVNPHMYKKLPFDPNRDFIAVTNVAMGPMLVVVNPKLPVKNIKELIALAKAKPGTINFGSAGVGSQVQMGGESLAAAAGIDIVHVPYKGEALGYNDLVAGQIQLMVGNIAAAAVFVPSGKLRALAVTGKERSKMLPDVPTVAESGLPGFDNTGWFGFMVPAGTPKAVVDKLQRDTAKVLDNSQMRGQLFVQGMTPVGNKSDEFAKAIKEESAKWALVIKERKLTAN
ncbi:MAG TPA: tripartite tricarboxylate transporter substrate binding protein [Burkholderiales bacterium]|jgi:tripartite-type tricarboxylate transporter receptor subunit TctC|nr:tripartite tricarboxylate transporter substrate binding protein [Burkholderiales bacterium]